VFCNGLYVNTRTKDLPTALNFKI